MDYDIVLVDKHVGNEASLSLKNTRKGRCAVGKIKNILAGVKARMPTLEKAKKTSVTGLVVILLLLLLIGWGLYEKFSMRPSEPPVKTTTAEKKNIEVECIKPEITMFAPVEPPKKKSGSHRIRPPRPTPEKAITAQVPKEGTECVVGEHHGVVKIIDGKIHCVWEERAKEQPVPMPTPVKVATAPTAPAVPVLSPPIESKSLLDGVDPDFGKTKVEFTPLPEKEAPPRRRRVVVVVDQPQYYGGWYGTQVPSPYYYTSTPTYVPTQQVIVAAPSVVGRPPSGVTGPAGPTAVGRAPSGVTR